MDSTGDSTDHVGLGTWVRRCGQSSTPAVARGPRRPGGPTSSGKTSGPLALGHISSMRVRSARAVLPSGRRPLHLAELSAWPLGKRRMSDDWE